MVGEPGPVNLVVAALRRDVGLLPDDFIVVGAAARDLVIIAATGDRPARATEDVDIAVGIATWSAYEKLIARLDSVGGSKHRFIVGGINVDIVPFGGIEDAHRTITWPDETAMNLLGFREAFDSAQVLTTVDGSTVRVASLEAQLVLKLCAWADRRHVTSKDAVDLRSILDASSVAPFVDSLYEDDLGLLEAYGFDPLDAAAHRLARDAAMLLQPTERLVVVSILRCEVSEAGTMPVHMTGDIGRNRELLDACLAGMSIGG